MTSSPLSGTILQCIYAKASSIHHDYNGIDTMVISSDTVSSKGIHACARVHSVTNYAVELCGTIGMPARWPCEEFIERL